MRWWKPNLSIAGDLIRRVLLCTINAQCEHPEQRRFDNDPIAVIQANRGDLVAAALTVLRAWHVSNDRIEAAPFGSFEEWSYRIRCPLLWLDRVDPCDSIKTVRENDPLRALLNTVLIQWKEALGTADAFTVQQIIDRATELATGRLGIAGNPPILPDKNFYHALGSVAGAPKGGGISNDRLGRWLGKNNGKIVGKLKLTRMGNSKGYPLWQILDV